MSLSPCPLSVPRRPRSWSRSSRPTHRPAPASTLSLDRKAVADDVRRHQRPGPPPGRGVARDRVRRHEGSARDHPAVAEHPAGLAGAGVGGGDDRAQGAARRTTRQQASDGPPARQPSGRGHGAADALQTSAHRLAQVAARTTQSLRRPAFRRASRQPRARPGHPARGGTRTRSPQPPAAAFGGAVRCVQPGAGSAPSTISCVGY